MVFFSELGFREKGRDIERKDSELALWKNLTMVREGIEFAFYDCGKIFRLLIYIYIYIYKTETFETPTIFHISTILKKKT